MYIWFQPWVKKLIVASILVGFGFAAGLWDGRQNRIARFVPMAHSEAWVLDTKTGLTCDPNPRYTNQRYSCFTLYWKY